jgi:hypothetical protein
MAAPVSFNRWFGEGTNISSLLMPILSHDLRLCGDSLTIQLPAEAEAVKSWHSIMPPRMGKSVFISYSRTSALEPARALCQALAERGIGAFMDEREITPGSPFPEDLAAALLESTLVFVFADAEYFRKPWCILEYGVALAPLRAVKEDGARHVAKDC